MENNDNSKSNRPANIAAIIGSSALALSFTSCDMTAADMNELGRQMGEFRETEEAKAKAKKLANKNKKFDENRGRLYPDKRVPQKDLQVRPNQTATRFSDREALNKFSLQRYRYIDAKVLANYWGERTPYDAKLRLGRKMLQFGPSNGPVHMNAARTTVLRKPNNQWPVNFGDGGYSFSDAERLGRYWGQGTYQAKVKIERHLINNQDHFTKQALAAARNY